MERGEGDSRKFGLRMIRELSRKVHLRRNRYTTFDRNGLLAPNAFWYKLVWYKLVVFPCICWGFPVVGAINGFVLIIKEKLL